MCSVLLLGRHVFFSLYAWNCSGDMDVCQAAIHVVCIIQLFHIGWDICDDILVLSAECLLDMVEALSV